MLSVRSALVVAASLTVAACADPAPDGEPGQTDPEELVETTALPGEAEGAKLNLNTTAEETFAALPGVDARMAQAFSQHRPYASVLQFRRAMAEYADADAIAGYEDLVFVPVDPNASDAETLAQLPGVEIDEAALLIEARPFDSDVAFLATLEPLVTPDEQSAAADYLVAE